MLKLNPTKHPRHLLRQGRRAAVAGLAMLGLLGGCATMGGGSSATDQVTRRVEARYAALVAKDYRKAYEFLTPAYRQGMPFISHQSAHRPLATYVSAKVLSVACVSDTACDAEIEIAYTDVEGVRFKPKGVVTSVHPERWVKIDGQWWLHFRR